MKAAIIGAGFVGLELARQLLSAGHEAVLMDTCPAPRGLGIPARPCDVLAPTVTLPPKLDAVFYLAQSPYYREFPEQAGHLFGVNTLGAVKAAEAALKTACRFFFYASTGNVYTPSFKPLAEDDPAENPAAYALSKHMAERALALFGSQFTVCLGRLFGVFGPGQERMLPALIRESLLNDEPLRLAPHPEHGPDGGLHVSFILNADLGRALVRLAEKALAGNAVPPILNFGGPESISIERLAGEMGRKMNRAPRFEHLHAARRFDLVADISLLRKTLDISFTPFTEAIAAMFQN